MTENKSLKLIGGLIALFGGASLIMFAIREVEGLDAFFATLFMILAMYALGVRKEAEKYRYKYENLIVYAFKKSRKKKPEPIYENGKPKEQPLFYGIGPEITEFEEEFENWLSERE